MLEEPVSVWRSSDAIPALFGSEGELISVSVSVAERDLESLLEALAEVDFPINPQIVHSNGSGGTAVEFPAYSSGLDQVRMVLARHGFNERQLRVTGILEQVG